MFLIFCACGCGKLIELYDSRGRSRKYVCGHRGKEIRNSRHISNDTEKKIIDVYLSGKSSRNTGKDFNISHHAVQCVLKRNNISPHSCLLTHTGIGNPMYGKTGEKSPRYKEPENRITPLRLQIRNSSQYSNWRTQIFGRDNFTCQHCGVRGTWLEAHHIEEFAKIFQKYNIVSFEGAMNCIPLWDLDNGTTLCKTCHAGTKGRR